ncbi:DinB family protein [Alteromonas gracilis]
MASWIDISRTPASEKDALLDQLRAQRIGLIRKVEDLGDAAARSTPSTSSLSLLGLVKHCAAWEERWLHVIADGREAHDGWPEVRPEPDADLTVDETDTVAHWLEVYRERGAVSDEVIAAHDLDDAVARTDVVEATLRYVVLHLIQETARHAGHADIIRESLDGTTGI